MLCEGFSIMKQYTHKEKAQNFVADFQSKKIIEYTPYAGGRTEYSPLNDREAKEVAKIALSRNIENLSFIVQRLIEQGHKEVSEHFSILLNEEKSILSEVERL